MRKVEKLLKSLNNYIAKAEEDDELKLVEMIPDFPGLDMMPKYVEDYEKKVAKLLRKQRKHFLDGVKSFVSKDITLEALLVFITSNLFASDEFAEEMEEETSEFLQLTVAGLAAIIMEEIDKDVPFEVLSNRSITWIEEWSAELGKLMKLNSHEALEKELKKVIENGGSIQEAELAIKDLPQFDRARARTTAVTEILTASSVAQVESYKQSPAVEKKRWRHSGSKKNNPREAHMDLDGEEIGLDEMFDVNGHAADHPRDTALPAGERVNCHCVLSAVVNEKILGLSKEEKEEMRKQALKD
ncbi:phage minor head protein [Domibacillus sp.]|uniref:phage minor head protein n=1 Tax=Domibacillus sp. TaxID=1969783 RepID=UPI0028125B9D|nr:phage minor head protein [Domibacillus sp.]